MADRNKGETDHRPERPVLFSILAETGISDCFSMEWLLDRFDQREKMA